MDSGVLAQMSHPGFVPAAGLPVTSSGLASRRGGQGIKPLSFDALKAASADKDNGAPTPRTSRSHLLAGLRTAPKSATAATFPASPPPAGPANAMRARNSFAAGLYGNNDSAFSGPKTSLPRYGQQQGFGGMSTYNQQYTTDQILAPPELQIDEQGQDQMDPSMYAQLMATNAYLAQQQQRLQQQLMNVQAAQQQFQNLNINQSQSVQQQLYQQQLYQQQQQRRNLHQQMLVSSMPAQGPIYTVVDPMTGQQAFYVDQSASQLNAQLMDQLSQGFQQQQHQQPGPMPSVQVSPPTSEAQLHGHRNVSPPRRYESPGDQPTPLPPPSANAFRRGHKKSSSLANVTNGGLAVATQEAPKSAGPKSAHFPLTPMTGTYGPGQGRAGEHPVRQPRGPPSFDELASKPTSKHEGSKNFATRTRRSAVHNLMKAGISRRQVTTTGSSGSISPISESAAEIPTPLTVVYFDSGRIGSVSLFGDVVENTQPNTRTSTGSWGAIGSDRPSSRQM